MRLTRVIAGAALAASCMASSPAFATESTATPTVTVPTDAVPDPLAISPSVISELTTLAMRYESNLAVAEERRSQAAEKERNAERQRDLASEYIAQVVDYAMSPSGDPFAQKLAALGAAESPEDLITGMFSTEQVTDAHEGRLTDAKVAFDAAQELSNQAAAFIKQAKTAEAAATRQLKDVQKLAEKLGLGSSSTPDGLPATNAEQQEWNAAATSAWREYVVELHKSNVKIPNARDVRKSKGFKTQTIGNAKVDVLPRQTIDFVDAIFNRLGDDYASQTNNDAWTCSGLFSKASGYSLSGTPAQLYETTVKVNKNDIRVGDLVFAANEKAGIHHVGVFVGDGKVIDAPGTRYQVGVSKLPSKIFAVTRPALGKGSNEAPKASSNTTICNATKPAAATLQGWTFPLKRGTYSISAGFGQGGGMWKSTHTGQDLAAPMGTPIFASRGGKVTLAEVGWAGTLITIDHPDGTAERYAHSSKVLVEDGQMVASGEQIALVGSRGNSTGPHLHFELTVNGEFVDPMPVLVQYLSTSSSGTGWGGYGNGQIPQGVLCPVDDVLLRCDVAKRASTLTTSFQRKFKQKLDFTAGYRDIVGQIERDPSGGLTDIPGTSSFGWGAQFKLGDLSKAQGAWVAKQAKSLGLIGQEPGTWSRTS